jgi:hypothetical protein
MESNTMNQRENAQTVDVVPAEDVRTKAAPLTGELLMRGRSRARDIVQPPRKTNLHLPSPPGAKDVVHEAASAIAQEVPGQRMREAGMLLIWIAVFLGTFLIGMSLID